LGKLLSALYLIGPFVWLAWTLLPRSRERSPAAFRRALVFGTALLAPHAAFELWKLSVLGVAGWWNQMTGVATFVLEYGAGDAPADRWAEFARRSILLDDRLAFPPLLFAATIALAWLASRHLPRPTRRFVWLLLGGVGLHLAYWLLLSDGRPRYAHIATVVWGFALATLLATVRGMSLRLGLSVVVAWTLVTGLPRLDRPLRLLAEARHPETSPFAAAQFVDDAIHTTTGGAPIGAVGGAHVAVLEYLSDEPGRFRIPPDAGGPVAWVIVDDRWFDPKDPVFAALFAECPTEVVRRPPYTLRRCSEAPETD
jgi:hypothetical protein